MRRSHALLAAFVAALSLVAAGCGGSGSAAPELTSFTQVAQKSAATDTASFELSVTVTVPGAGEELSFSAAGGFDTPAKRAQLTVDLSSLAELFKSLGPGLGSMFGGGTGAPSESDWKLEVIQDGDTAYINFPLLARELPAGKTWVKGDAKDLSGASAGQLGQFGSLAGSDPRDVFSFLKGVSGSIETVGSESVRGEETTHYRATLDAKKLEELVPAEQRQALGGLEMGAAQAGLDKLPLDIWIDADERIRKLSVDIDEKDPSSGEQVQASIVAEFYDYGKPLDLELPPADQVVDASSLR